LEWKIQNCLDFVSSNVSHQVKWVVFKCFPKDGEIIDTSFFKKVLIILEVPNVIIKKVNFIVDNNGLKNEDESIYIANTNGFILEDTTGVLKDAVTKNPFLTIL
jgi:hypothetical protein